VAGHGSAIAGVDDQGRPQNLKVLRSLGWPRPEAIEAVKSGASARQKDGKPVPVMATIEVNSGCSKHSDESGPAYSCTLRKLWPFENFPAVAESAIGIAAVSSPPSCYWPSGVPLQLHNRLFWWREMGQVAT